MPIRFARPLFAVLCLALWAVPVLFGQNGPTMDNPVAATPTAARLAGMDQRQALAARSLVANVPFENIGPTVMSGRVVDLDADPADPTHFFVAYASGGLWETTNNGLSFVPHFEDAAVMTLGDLAVDWAHGGTIWLGTGENNASRSSYAGAGVYRSDDGGATWTHRGLDDTHHISRIILHPDDPNTLWVAALGALYGPSPARGVYKTTDGGATWAKTLFVNDNAGAVDLVVDPLNPDVLYAATWERARRAWNFVEAGPGSGIYRSTDGGTTWSLLTTEGSGFPTGDGVGRIGLAMYGGGTLFALLDNQYRRAEEDDVEDDSALTRDALRDLSRDAFLALDDETLEAFLRDENFPDEYDAAGVKRMVRDGEIVPLALVEYLEDANSQLFNAPVIGAEIYRSDDGGQSWTRTHEDPLDGVYYSYGYYFGQIRVAPETPERLYIMGVPILRSDDGGATWKSINGRNVHVDHHALWVNPDRPGHLLNGNDGGVNISYDDGETWFKANTPSVGQFYAIAVDEAEPYHVYGGLQDNGVWDGPHDYEADLRWQNDGDYPYDRLLGGDGMQVEVDTRDNTTVYTGFQFGFYFRVDKKTRRRTMIRPRHDLGERPLRFNWQAPIHLSRHNQDILYFGANKLFRSMNQGADWQAISDDLTQGGRPGDVPYGTLATLDESPLRFGLIYTGSDDGLVYVTRDGGHVWTRISDSLPQDLWVSRVEASRHEEGRVFVTLNGYRWDHFDAYLYRSDDYGTTWTRLGTDLPPEPVNVVVEDPANAEILYVGTDHGLYVSLDGGATFMAMGGAALPAVPVHDLKIQAREKDLVVGTHGRSLYVADLEHVQALTPAMIATALHVFDLGEVRHDEDWGSRFAAWADYEVPEVTLPYFSAARGTATIRLKAEDGTLLHSFTDDAEAGLNYPTYDLALDAAAAARLNRTRDKDPIKPADNGTLYLPPGTYTVEVERGGTTATGAMVIKSDD